MKKTHAKGHVRKHVKSAHHKHHHHHLKHHPVHHHKGATAHGHHVHAKAKHPAHAKAKALALDPGDVGCCTIEALAASLLCQGLPVTDAQVLELFQIAGGDEDRGMPVRVALEAASEYGLAGVRLAGFAEEVLDYPSLPLGKRLRDRLKVDLGEGDHLVGLSPLHASSVILGLDLPGPHAVLATPEGWWSWGELWCPWCEWPDAVIDEAWAISWLSQDVLAGFS